MIHSSKITGKKNENLLNFIIIAYFLIQKTPGVHIYHFTCPSFLAYVKYTYNWHFSVME